MYLYIIEFYHLIHNESKHTHTRTHVHWYVLLNKQLEYEISFLNDVFLFMMEWKYIEQGSYDPGFLHELKQACTSKYSREMQTHWCFRPCHLIPHSTTLHPTRSCLCNMPTSSHLPSVTDLQLFIFRIHKVRTEEDIEEIECKKTW